MKKNYIAPQSSSYGLMWENGVALNIISGGNDTPTLNSEDDILSNKKENPVWKGDNKSGMWSGLEND